MGRARAMVVSANAGKPASGSGLGPEHPLPDAPHDMTPTQVRALLAAQMPDLAELAIKRVGPRGTDHNLFRLGTGFVARFPRLLQAEGQISTQARWLPRLSHALALDVPLTLRFGLPGLGYAFRWTVLPWLPGHAAFTGPLDQSRAAVALADFLQQLQAQPTPEGAPQRGSADRLEARFANLGPAIGQFQGEADPRLLAQVAARMRKLPRHEGPLVWVHGDLHPMNLLASRGRLTGVIDWGGLGVGDPAIDLMIGWTLFDGPARAVFRTAMAPDPDAWSRGRAVAFAKAVTAIPQYRRTNPGYYTVMRMTLQRILDDHAFGDDA